MKSKTNGWEWEVSRLYCESLMQSYAEEDLSDVVVPSELDARVRALLQEEKTLSVRLARRRAVAILVAVLLLLLTACMAIEPIRESLYRMIMTPNDGYVTYRSELAETNTDTDVFKTKTKEPVKFVKKLPGYLPQGFELYADNSSDEYTGVYYFNNETHTYICYQQSVIGKRSYHINSENVEITNVLVNGWEGVATMRIVDGVTLTSLRWHDNNYDYAVDAHLTLEEVLQIAESIYNL